MTARIYRGIRWLGFIASGLIVLQVPASCDPTLQFIQTGLLGGITGLLVYLARNI